MAGVKFHHVYKFYNKEDRPSVEDFHLDIEDGEFLVLVGPSGCGKTTTLRMLAGLEDVSRGDIYIGDKYINYVSPKNRDIAMVFQNYALYPNLSVFENMALGLKLRKVAKHEVQLRVDRAAKILEIGALLGKRPNQLSGGQKQRVALGRAIVREPQVFLMDEPLSNLDAKLRTQTRAELIKLHSQLQTTAVYVTHDQTEAMTMGTRIVVMKDGRIQQVAPPQQLYDRPVNMFVAGFIGSPQMNFIEGQMTEREGDYYFENKRMRLALPAQTAGLLKRSGVNLRNLVLGIRPEHILMSAHAHETYPQWKVSGIVEMKELMGADTFVFLGIGQTKDLIFRVEAHTQVQLQERIEVVVLLDKAVFFEKESGKAILAARDDGR
ncbi:ABC transporter ATP-binding protein [Paenibacillus nasutitermitis]|uniref:ABC transporter ATP-binding protein n=1 Tax=Paenibacillus nasutitermitis TaxID=1652958 RepID=A0A916YQW5_9BACL|nr:sn-glycerol-3-phosphate ABC transporter ATP-binding protein UgpC [Paenibacillus nasutitermitis]GGD57229.1 ABC transporter ATP-binding protein [Paenibacillus nasutitermitis]